MKDSFSITGWKEEYYSKLIKETALDQESVEEAFVKAGVDMSKPVYVLEAMTGKETGPAYKVAPKVLAAKLQKIKDKMEGIKPGVGFDYDLSKVYKPKDYDLEGVTGKLAVMIGRTLEYIIFQ